MAKLSTYKNWHVTKDPDKILWLCLDKAKARVNSINKEILDELENILDAIDSLALKGVVFGSAKDTGFIAGADIESFTHFESLEDAKDFIGKGQTVFNRISDLSIPTVAMIEGFCLGGGLEFALACRYRIAENSSKTRLGLPEVRLGIHPGWGGTVRLPALIGATNALPLILSGKIFDPEKAYKLGIVDEAVPKRQLESAVRYYLLHQPRPHHPSLSQRFTNLGIIRPIIAKRARIKLADKIKPEHYPAPFAVIDNWLKNGVDLKNGLIAEARSNIKLMLDEKARNLVRVFFLQEELKSLGKESDFKAKHIHVIGAGTMGGDIAAWCANKGLRVTLQDQKAEQIAPAIKRAHKLFQEKLKKSRKIQEAMDRLIPDVAGDGVKHADIIIEAVYEDLSLKQTLLKQIESQVKRDAIIATNTSSIPLDEMNSVMKHPELLVGVHFFNPVAKMPLVEVVHGKITSDKVKKNAMAFVRQIDRLPLPVMSSPGFLVNRVLMPYLMEAFELTKDGTPLAVIDQAAINFGMPIGPIELADTVGLDVCLYVAENLTQHFGGTIPEKLREMVQHGWLGKKTGRGFYQYKNNKPRKILPKDFEPDIEITDRLILRMLNEALACLREKIIASDELVDAGMIFGTGFAPFRGGPIQYIRATGARKLKERLVTLQEKYGDRFKPDPKWEQRLNDEG